MASETEISNLAISHLGIGKEITSLETEKSEEARACRRYFDISRDATLRDFRWPFATTIQTLQLIEEEPNDEWGFSYRYPIDCVKVLKILSGIRNESRDVRVPYKIIYDATGPLILTDMEAAQMEYILRVENPQFYPPDFMMALSYRLAYYIAPRITVGDGAGFQKKMLELYLFELSRAQATASNEEQPDALPDSEFIRARESADVFDFDRGGFRPF